MQDQLLKYLDKISNKLSINAKFDIFDADDIKQEIYLLLVQGYKIYDPERGDEFSFLFNFVNCRLRSLKRDRFINPASKNSINRLKIQSASMVREDSSMGENLEIEEIDKKDYFSKVVDSKIPAQFRMDYLRLLDGVEISYNNKLKLMESINIIIRTNNGKQV